MNQLLEVTPKLARSAFILFAQRFVYSVAIVMSFVLSACQSKTESSSKDQLEPIGDSVRVFAATVAHDVTFEGPKAWLRFFSRSSQFFMASEGKLVFPTIDSATVFVDSLAVWIRSIQLSWENISVDPLTSQFAVFRSSFHDLVTDRSGRRTAQDGYFTATVERTGVGWQFRNLHWSIVGNHTK
jgi:hypothetical protein